MTGSYCEGPLWDGRNMWGDNPPVFTECFEDTVLVFVPSFYALFGGITYYYFRRTWPGKALPITILHIAKLSTICAQILLHSYGAYYGLMAESPSVSGFVADLLRVLSFLMVFILQVRDRNHGISTSAFVAIFWALELVFELFVYYRYLLTAFLFLKTIPC
ncbi:multidrug resistance-associated protein 1-like [Galendromus occidentalis]|uniref:Multidrug resistance-associated protein 1-like n=1 Tax=Galendromus occidentalis TaxID=34638 RepID=A0AAJ7L5U7_9ACAR|nr:multidrug resistance-associated protein 1-like [Galendromus occidentalis]